MALLERIAEDLKSAMRAQETLRRDTLRMVRTEFGRRELELGHALTDADALEILLRAVKTRKESLEQYEGGGRADLADKERQEIAIIEAYLPKGMDEGEAKAAIVALATELGVTAKKDMGRLMKEVTARFRGQIDGKLAAKIAGEVLQ